MATGFVAAPLALAKGLERASLVVGLALTVGGLFAVLVAAPPRSRGGGGVQRRGLLWLAVALFVAGLYTKQSFFFAPAAALAYLFFLVDRWQAIKMAVALI